MRHLRRNVARLRRPAYPTLRSVRGAPRELYEYSNEALLLASRAPDAHDAHQERLIREIMVVDKIDYPRACAKMKEIFEYNSKVSNILTVPLHTGLAVAVVGAIGCVPLVFHEHSAQSFADLIGVAVECHQENNFAQVGQATWSYMEPILGTASFSILCLQLLRGAMVNMAYQPYIDFVHSHRANKLAKAFPQYSKAVVKDFGRSQPFRGAKYNPLDAQW